MCESLTQWIVLHRQPCAMCPEDTGDCPHSLEGGGPEFSGDSALPRELWLTTYSCAAFCESSNCSELVSSSYNRDGVPASLPEQLWKWLPKGFLKGDYYGGVRGHVVGMSRPVCGDQRTMWESLFSLSTM